MDEDLRSFLASPRVEVLPLDGETSHRHALIMDALRRRGTPIGTNDVWLAASAAQHGLRVLTCDRDLRRIEHVLVDDVGRAPVRPRKR